VVRAPIVVCIVVRSVRVGVVVAAGAGGVCSTRVIVVVTLTIVP